jgi:hypothetical protein
MKSNTITTIKSTMAPLKDVMFPRIYICNLNQVVMFYSHISINTFYQSNGQKEVKE